VSPFIPIQFKLCTHLTVTNSDSITEYEVSFETQLSKPKAIVERNPNPSGERKKTKTKHW